MWTTVVVGAVVLVAVVGIADAIRGGEERPAAPTTTADREVSTEPGDVRSRLERQGIGGLLFLAVRRGTGCVVDVVGLPTLSRSRILNDVPCRIRVGPTGLVAAGWPCGLGKGRFVAQTRSGVRSLQGCAPAWRPGGSLTWVSPRGDVIEFVEPCSSVEPCMHRLVTADELPGRARDLVWLGENRLIALVGLWQFGSLAVLVDGELASTRPLCCPFVQRLRSIDQRARSVHERLFLARAGSGEVSSFDAYGRPVRSPALPPTVNDGRAFAGSAGGEWIAATLGPFVTLYGPGQPPDTWVTLELGAVEDLNWFGS